MNREQTIESLRETFDEMKKLAETIDFMAHPELMGLVSHCVCAHWLLDELLKFDNSEPTKGAK